MITRLLILLALAIGLPLYYAYGKWKFEWSLSTKVIVRYVMWFTFFLSALYMMALTISEIA